MTMDIDKVKVTNKYDRRIKIDKQEYPKIIRQHTRGKAIRELARKYGVDKRLIQFIIYPERKARSLALRAERGGSKKYYDKDKWRGTMREHRAYKRSLIKKGKIA